MFSRRTLPPGPKGHFLTGDWREFYSDQLSFLTECAGRFGDIVRLRFLHVPVYLLSNPTDIETVFTSRNFAKPMSLRMPLQRRIFGHGLLSSQGEDWLHKRRIIQRAFNHDYLPDYAATVIDCTRELLAGWHANGTRDIYDDMRGLALTIATRSLFKIETSEEAATVRDACKAVTEIFVSQSGPLWILDNILPTPNNMRFRKAIQRIDRFIFDLISRSMTKPDKRGDVLSMLMADRDKDGTPLTLQQLRDELATLLFASHEAAALALTWTCYLLAQHEDVQASLAAEIRDLPGNRTTLEASDLPALRQIRRVVLEAMRLYPPNRSVAREALNDCEIGGYLVRAGAQILMSQWVVHRDSRHFENPAEFKPKRWTPEFIQRLPKYAYFPFGGGPRVCIGQEFAMMEAVLVIAAILQNFKFVLADGQVIEPCPAILLRPSSAIRILVNERRL